MRKLAVTLFVLFTLSGCAFIQARKVDWDNCKKDETCYANAKSEQAKYEKIGEVVGDLVGAAPFIPPTAAKYASKGTSQAFGWGAFALFMLIGGHAITKKPKEAVVNV